MVNGRATPPLDMEQVIARRVVGALLLCVGGEGEVLHLPHEGGLLDQPADWYEALSIVVNEVRKRYSQTGTTGRRRWQRR